MQIKEELYAEGIFELTTRDINGLERTIWDCMFDTRNIKMPSETVKEISQCLRIYECFPDELYKNISPILENYYKQKHDSSLVKVLRFKLTSIAITKFYFYEEDTENV